MHRLSPDRFSRSMAAHYSAANGSSGAGPASMLTHHTKGTRLIEVPYMAGHELHDKGSGLHRLATEAEIRLLEKGIPVTVEPIVRGTPFRDTATASATVHKRVAASV